MYAPRSAGFAVHAYLCTQLHIAFYTELTKFLC